MSLDGLFKSNVDVSLSLSYVSLSALSLSALSLSLLSLSLLSLSALSLSALSLYLSLFLSLLSLTLSLGVLEDRMVSDTIGIGVNMLRYVCILSQYCKFHQLLT